MDNTSLNSIILTLLEVSKDPSNQEQAITNFQKIIWDGLHEPLQKNVREVLVELAYDLDFCDSMTKCEMTVREALARLKELDIFFAYEKLRRKGSGK